MNYGTKAICDACWIPFAYAKRGYVYQPTRVRDVASEPCCMCSGDTTGIYVRVDLDAVPHP